MKYLLAILIMTVFCISSHSLFADSDDRRGPDVSAVNNQLYADECGSCHFAYQAAFLPERSWRKLMANLEDHFGENAELDEGDRKAIEAYLVNNAGDHSNYRRARKFMRSIASGDTPLRITEVPYFVHEHNEIPKRVLQSDQVRSLSNCDVCHQQAVKGSYREREINIPGYGRWDD